MNSHISHWSTNEIVDLPKTVIMTSDISDGAKITLAYLLTSNKSKQLCVSQARVADDLSKSRKQINKHYLELEKNGYIILIRIKGASSVIKFTVKSVPDD